MCVPFSVVPSLQLESTMSYSRTSYDSVAKKINESKALNSETKEIFKLFLTLLQTLNKDRDQKVAEIDQKFAESHIKNREKLEHLQTTVTEKIDSEIDKIENKMSSVLEKNDEKLLNANEEVARLKNEVAVSKKFVDEQDAYIRRETLIFSGDKIPKATANEDCTAHVRRLIRENLNLDMDPLISTAHRLGKPPLNVSTPDKRDIVVKFCQRDVKHKVLAAARERKVRGLFVNESLTPTRQTIHYVLRQLVKTHKKLVRGTYTQNGRLFVFTKPAVNAPDDSSSIKTEINTMEKLSSFCDDFIKVPLNTFLVSKKKIPTRQSVPHDA